MEAQEEGNNDFKLRYGVSAPDPDEVARLEQQEQGGADEAPGLFEIDGATGALSYKGTGEDY